MKATANPHVVAFVVIRVTAVMLAVLVLGHFAVTHIVTDVSHTDASFVLKRWSQTLWIAWDLTMLLAAFAHAGCGVWLLISQEVRSPRKRGVLTAVVLGVGGLTVLGMAALTVGIART